MEIAEGSGKASEMRYQELFNNMSSGVAVYHAKGDGEDFILVDLNKAGQRITGVCADHIGRSVCELFPGVKELGLFDVFQRVLRTGKAESLPVSMYKDQQLTLWLDNYVYKLPSGELVAVFDDVTARMEAEEALKRSEERYRTILNEMEEGYQEVDLEGNFTFFNDAFLKLFGYGKKEMMGTNFARYAAEEAIAKRMYRAYSQIYRTGAPIKRDEWDIVRKDGVRRTLEFWAAMLRDEKGRPNGFRGIVRDITEQRQAEEEREKLHAQLNQAQKMESIGRLAGGVAHDFNNKLTVILGYVQLAMDGLDRTDPLVGNLQEVMKAGKQSVDIVRQLLAFARKQTIIPEVVDLNEIVEGMLKMLRRLIGEDIDLLWQPDTNLWPVRMDPAQIDQILANLCVNARDAISGVGKITIETENRVLDEDYCEAHAGAVPGEYVMLTVSDDGCGMDRETQENIFEPFFTTKEVGKGTGLGLSTVYGIVKQNQGYVDVTSEPGKGTRFKIYLPRHAEEADEGIEATRAEPPRARGETILVVEDEISVLDLARRILEGLGYSVLTSASPSEAVNMAREYAGEIHLLMTDVVLPEMSGKDMAGEISKIRPAIRTLYMSGYTANVIAYQGVLDEGVAFIEKPFTLDSLARKVREAIDSE